jgi:hypothetical protein
MATTHQAIRRLVLAGLVLWAVQARLGAEPPPEVKVTRGAGAVVTIDATDASVAELLRMLSRAAKVRIALAAMPSKTVTLELPNVQADVAVQAICDAAGLRLTKKDGVFVIDEPGDVRVEVSRGPAKAESSWRAWDGRLPEQIATRHFEPQSTKKTEDGSRLAGTLNDVVSDLKAAGVDISVDPSATVGLIETAVELPWHGGANTVETVLLRLALSAGSGSPRIALLQWVDEEGHTADRLRVVPSSRWPSALSEYVQALGPATYMRPLVTYGPMDERSVQGYSLGSVDLFVATEPPPAALQAKIDLDLNEAPLADALKAIEARLGKPINLAEGVKTDTKVSVDAKQAPIIRVLTGILRPLGLTISYDRGGDFDGVTVVPAYSSPNVPFSLSHHAPER